MTTVPADAATVTRPPRPKPVSGDPRQVLRDQFHLPDFRDGQLAVIERLLSGKRVAAVFPTGAGKSLCYQLPSQMFEGTTVVVSPLIALMKDQCDALKAKGVAAARLDSSQSPQELQAAMSGIRSGETKILYASPERFFNERFLASLGTLHVSLFAIDEAHCISQWGHNFRPDYLKLADLTQKLGAERVLALTATATPEVLSDIRDAFDIAGEDAIRTRFHRPNLKLHRTICDSTDHYATLRDRLKSRKPGPTLVYVSLQRTTDEVAQQLVEDGFSATAYHAGLDTEVRANIQRDFLASDDAIIVATIAFGMGIDKSNLRYVYHFNPPKSLEGYAQEIGRAGRDGDDATCEMLLVPEDRVVLENFVYGDTPSRHSVGRLIELLHGQADTFHLSHYRTSTETDIRTLVVRTLLTYLELDGYLAATSPRYDTYKIRPLVTSQAILSHFDGERREFISGILSSLSKGRKLFLLNMVVAAKKLNTDRERIIRAIDHMVEKGWLEVQVSDLVHGYRWCNRLTNPKTVADDLFDRLTKRESGEIARLDDVFGMATGAVCLPSRLAQHFGESLSEPCGECSVCLGMGAEPLQPAKTRPLGTSVRSAMSMVAKQYPDHFTTTRDRARFLCGLSSPAFVRARLTKEASFGICNHLPFADVLRQLDEA